MNTHSQLVLLRAHFPSTAELGAAAAAAGIAKSKNALYRQVLHCRVAGAEGWQHAHMSFSRGMETELSAPEHPLSCMSMGGLPGSTGRRAAHSPSAASSGELLSAGQENPRTDMLTHCICNASHWLLSLWASQHAWSPRTASCAGRNMRQGDAPSHDSEMFLNGMSASFLAGKKN